MEAGTKRGAYLGNSVSSRGIRRALRPNVPSMLKKQERGQAGRVRRRLGGTGVTEAVGADQARTQRALWTLVAVCWKARASCAECGPDLATRSDSLC